MQTSQDFTQQDLIQRRLLDLGCALFHTGIYRNVRGSIQSLVIIPSLCCPQLRSPCSRLAPGVMVHTTCTMESPSLPGSVLDARQCQSHGKNLLSLNPTRAHEGSINLPEVSLSALAPNIGASVCLTHDGTRNCGGLLPPKTLTRSGTQDSLIFGSQNLSRTFVAILWDSVWDRSGAGCRLMILEDNAR